MSIHDIVALLPSNLSAKQVDLHIVRECLKEHTAFFQKNFLGDQKYESVNNTEYLAIAVEISNTTKIWMIIEKFMKSSINNRPVIEIIMQSPQYDTFCKVMDRLMEIYSGSGFSASNLQNALRCSFFPEIRKAVSRELAIAERDMSRTKKIEEKTVRIYMQAADFILKNTNASHFEILLNEKECALIVRNFDTSVRMKLSGLTQTKSEKGAIFEKITVRWFQDNETIHGLRQSEMKRRMISWYEGRINIQEKYKNIAQMLESCDSIEKHLIMISSINQFILEEDVASLFLVNEEDCDNTVHLLTIMDQEEIQRKSLSYMRNFAQPFLGMKNHNDIILGVNPVSYLENWLEFQNRGSQQEAAWDKICEVYQKLMCMEKKTRKFFSVLCQQDDTNYDTIIELLKKRFRGNLSYDKLDNWLTANDLSINNSEMSIKMFSTGGTELINYCMSNSSAFQRSVLNSIDDNMKIYINGEYNYTETLNTILAQLRIRTSQFVQVVPWKFVYPVLVQDPYADILDMNDDMWK